MPHSLPGSLTYPHLVKLTWWWWWWWWWFVCMYCRVEAVSHTAHWCVSISTCAFVHFCPRQSWPSSFVIFFSTAWSVSTLLFCGWRGSGLVSWLGGLQMLFWGFYPHVKPKRSIPKPDQCRKHIIQQESLGTDMFQELKNTSYTRYHTELINRSYGGWLVSVFTLL